VVKALLVLALLALVLAWSNRQLDKEDAAKRRAEGEGQ